MKLFHRRHYTSLIPHNFKDNPQNPSPQPEILSLCKLGFLSKAIHLLNSTDSNQLTIKPVIYASLLQTCVKAVSFSHGLQIHSYIIKSGLGSDRFVGNSLLSMYFKLGHDFCETRKVFDNLFEKDVISWTSMISGYVHVGKCKDSLEMFRKMLDFGVEPNAFTLSAVIKACSELEALRIGVCFHGVVVKRGFGLNFFIVSSLIDMYGRNFDVEDARRLFVEMLEPDAICWTSLISAYTRNDQFEGALDLFYLMNRKYRVSPDGFTFATILTACGHLGRVKHGKEVHAKVVTSGICGNLVVESSILDMYGKCGLVKDSRAIFDRMQKKNVVSWCALLGAYCQNGDFKAVLDIFREMETKDMYCFGTVLRACAGLAVVRQGKEVHCQYLRKVGWRDIIVESALVDVYAKCGCVNYAERMFLEIPVKNLITWNSMICGLAQNGKAEEALAMFNEMLSEGMKPNYITFIGVLFACSHARLVDQGREYFKLMGEFYRINAGIEHVNCMVDLLGRAGLLEEADDLLKKSVFKDHLSLLAALLGACTSYSNLNVAERVAKKMMELEPENHLSYVLLANVYKVFNQWDDAEALLKLMKDRGVKKTAGKSWIDIKDKGSNLDLDNSDSLQKGIFPPLEINFGSYQKETGGRLISDDMGFPFPKLIKHYRIHSFVSLAYRDFKNAEVLVPRMKKGKHSSESCIDDFGASSQHFTFLQHRRLQHPG
ncbi:hypothetical protein IFM89_015577 [Coptis chinensis]|uniref:Pentatricopeptide repeat-containing protein n=1 Tax=Coptis chinensis TaxID=261450 RepID=A0A835LY58_9MAGN|nr:hypothetical protein IFM89_015577 [Coptis chinensis]